MKNLLFTMLAGWLALACATAGTITGIVRAQGKPGAEADAADGKYASRKFKFIERVNYAELRDFVVYIEGPLPTNVVVPQVVPGEVTTKVVTKKIVQKEANFVPHVLPIQAGTVVEWPNNDDILHNVFSISDPKPFDLGLYKNPDVKRITFEKPGRVDVFCSIHTGMSCIILVLETPWFAVTDTRGRYAITNVPPGVYKLKAWHERLPSQVREITVPEKGQLKADFTLGITNLPQY